MLTSPLHLGNYVTADTLIAGKYGWQYRAVMLAERLVARRSKPRVILSITLPSRP
jgi:hypothetical protein